MAGNIKAQFRFASDVALEVSALVRMRVGLRQTGKAAGRNTRAAIGNATLEAA